MSESRLSTEALVYLLGQHAPKSLDSLRATYPSEPSLSGGTVLGDEKSTASKEATALIELARASLKTALTRVEPDLTKLRGNLDNAKRLSGIGILFGGALGILGWQPITDTLPKTGRPWIGLLIFAFAIGLPYLAYRMESRVISRGRDRKDAYAFLCGLTWQVDILMEQLRLVEQESAGVELQQCVNRANALAAELIASERILFRAPGAV